MTPTVTCPTCGKPHGLFWIVDGKGMRKLHIVCNKAKYQKGGPNPELRSHTVILCVHTPELDKEHKNNKDIPEQWSARWREKKKEEQTCELRLM